MHYSCTDTKGVPNDRRKCLKVTACILLLHYREKYIWVLVLLMYLDEQISKDVCSLVDTGLLQTGEKIHLK